MRPAAAVLRGSPWLSSRSSSRYAATSSSARPSATRFDRAHFARYGAYSLDFEMVYYVLDPAYNRYMDIQQAINFRVHEEFERGGIEFAYPTQTLLLRREEAQG